MNLYLRFFGCSIVLLGLSLSSCKKFLNEKPLNSLFVPNTLEHLESILDNYAIMNARGPALLELVADNYYVTTADWKSQVTNFANLALNYIWDENAVPHDPSWNLTYQGPIYYANVVLYHLPLIKDGEKDKKRYDAILGSALFHRAFAFFQIAQLFCAPYSMSSTSDLGIVLRTGSNINERSTRATVLETYNQIIDDLKEAANLLPATTLYPTRPNRGAAYGALSRVYLSMREYTSAAHFAELCLNENNKLLDYNSLSASSPIPFFNEEVIFHNVTQNVTLLANTRAKIDSLLYKSYDSLDLRKGIFFRKNTAANALGTYGFRGSYSSTGSVLHSVFNGITTSEVLLIRSECYARSGNINLAIEDLNKLMKRRWSNTVTYSPIVASSAEDALNKILQERRKELVYRGLRWTDLRRFNIEGRDIQLNRVIDGITYSLPPNDPRWIMLIPWDVINRSGIQQNDR